MQGAQSASLRTPLVHAFAGRDLPRLLEDRAARCADRPYLIWSPFEEPGRIWTYAQFLREVCSVAAGLIHRGVRPADAVLLHMENCPEAAIVWHACARIGAVAVSSNTRCAPAELAYFAEHSRAVGAVTQPKFAQLVDACKLGWVAVTDQDSVHSPDVISAPLGSESYAALLRDPNEAPLLEPRPLSPAGIQYTSGTSARPKAVVWTHAHALWIARTSAANQHLRSTDVHLAYLPLFHANALGYSMLASLWAGASVVLQPRFSVSRFWPTALRHGCTVSFMVGFCVRALMAHEVPPRHLFRLFSPAICSVAIERYFGVRTLGMWAMTETGAQAIVSDLDDRSVSLSVGRPAPGYDVAVLDDDGRPIGPGGTGQLRVRGIRGVTLFSEYFADAGATQAAFDDHGYLITGDRVTLLEDGQLRFADRDKDMLKVGGENVASSEIEAIIAAVAGVSEVAVVARKDPMLEETPVAFVIAAAHAATAPEVLCERVLHACRAQLADFKCPREVRIVDDLPRSTLQKIAKAQLRALLEAEAERADAQRHD